MSLSALEKYLERMKGKEKKKEEVDGYLIIPLERMKVKEDYVMIFQQNIRTVAKMGLSQHEWMVFAYLLGITDFENWIRISQKAMAKELGIAQPHISKALKSLEQRGLIERSKDGRNNIYKINPNIAWKGREKNRKNILKLNDE